MKTINIQLPSFGGFYESLWRNSDTEYCEVREFENNLEFGTKLEHLDDWGLSADYEKDICKAYVEYVGIKLCELLDDKVKLVYDCMTSPRFYNFTTDKIFADLSWDEDYNISGALLVLMEKHKNKLSELIHRYHTSCDGFISFMDNAYDEWYNRIAGMSEDSGDIDLYVSYLLTYLVMCENNFEDLHDMDEDAYMWVSDWRGIVPYCYLEPQSDEAKEEYNAYLEKVEYKRMLERDQLSIDFQLA